MSSTNNKYASMCSDIYDGQEGKLWELLMGRHIHIGGRYTSEELALKAGIQDYMNGLDLCCNSGQGMRFLIKQIGVKSMRGVDISSSAIKRGIERCREQNISSQRVSFINTSVSNGLPMLKDNSFDFAWSHDAFCYIPDRYDLIKTITRVVKPNGIIAFTDWVGGSVKMTNDEYKRYTTLMSFPNVETLKSYSNKLVKAGCHVKYAYDTKRFIECVQLYIDMMTKQHKDDVLDIYKGDMNAFDSVLSDMKFMLDMAKQDKICHGLFVAQNKKSITSKL